MLQRDHPRQVGGANAPMRSSALLHPGGRGKRIPASLIAALAISLFAAPATAQVADQELLEKHGVGIPEVTVRLEC